MPMHQALQPRQQPLQHERCSIDVTLSFSGLGTACNMYKCQVLFSSGVMVGKGPESRSSPDRGSREYGD